MASQSLESLRRVVTVAWPQMAERQAKALLIRTARSGHQKIMQDQTARGGFTPEFDVYANRPGNTALESVVLPGPIVYRYRYLREIIQLTLDELRKASPVVSGDYVRSHTLYVNGTPVATLPVRLSPADEVFIANPIVYARRIEIGKTKSGRSFVMQVPNRIYERVAKKIVTPRYRNQAKVTFGYVSIPNAYTIQGGLSSHYVTGKRMRKRRQIAGSQVKAPAIFFSILK